MLDNASEIDVLRQVAERDESYDDNYDVAASWDAIKADLKSRGPFTRMLMELRASASTALTELVYATATDTAKVQSLQAEVRRYTHMMTILSEYRARAEATQAADEAEHEYSDEDLEFIATLER
jgi:hypothetical protein